MIPLVADSSSRPCRSRSARCWNRGILLAAIVAVLLNMYFNGLGTAHQASREAGAGARHSDAG